MRDNRRLLPDIITLYGRKPVLEVLQDDQIEIFRLHLARSNRSGEVMDRIISLARQRDIETLEHTREALSRISRNGRQDQGVAIDILTPGFRDLAALPDGEAPLELLALDRITNPQNLGMIIRSVAASPLAGLVLPRKGCARIDPLVHKASAGTLIHAHIFHCATLEEGLETLRERGLELIGLEGAADTSLYDLDTAPAAGRVYILGNETEGLSQQTRAACDHLVRIPLAGGVESINVAAAATLVAFREAATGVR